MSDKIAIKNQDLVLRVSHDINPSVWNGDKYFQFVNRLCGTREYQKEAIWTALRYLLGEQYENLAGLAHENWQNGSNEALVGKFRTFESFRDKLSFPDKLAGSLDLATGTGKSYVLYGRLRRSKTVCWKSFVSWRVIRSWHHCWVQLCQKLSMARSRWWLGRFVSKIIIRFWKMLHHQFVIR